MQRIITTEICGKVVENGQDRQIKPRSIVLTINVSETFPRSKFASQRRIKHGGKKRRSSTNWHTTLNCDNRGCGLPAVQQYERDARAPEVKKKKGG